MAKFLTPDMRKMLPAKKPASPRYQKIARDLRQAIASGRYQLGAQLPTEEELCEQLGVSRFTVREAIRVLSIAGLVRRKPRAGTIVVALPDDTRYNQSIGSLRDLLQYAQTTDLRYAYVGRIHLSKALARTMSTTVGKEWVYAVALRHDMESGTPICVTRLYLNPALQGIERALRHSRGAVYSLIEREYGVRIERVEQLISGIIIDEQDASNLAVARGTPGLSIRRSYFDEKGRLVEMSDSVHPANRFTYRMELRR